MGRRLIDNRTQPSKRAERLRDLWFAAHGPCARCGSADRMELDHVDRTTKVSHRIWTWTIARRLAELAKCQILCHACHLAKSRAEMTRPTSHGTQTQYRKGCRCELCRAAVRAYNESRKRRAVAQR